MQNTTYKDRGQGRQTDLFSPPDRSPLPVWRACVGGKTISYTLKRSSRARHIRLQVGIGTGLEVVAPARMSLAAVEKAIREKAGWISKHCPATASRRLSDGTDLMLLGETKRLCVMPARPGRPPVRLSGRFIEARLPFAGTARLRDELKRWYIETAEEVIRERVAFLSRDERVNIVRIRDQKTMWGSCSPGGNLSFNWRLVMAPLHVIDYLVVHELVHFRHPDHSRRYWDEVGRRCPGYRVSQAWLKENAHLLDI